ncbi:MAG TPA: glycosyltransferase family 4 protein [Gammaproteobacteria bacterium]|nr:glycosyltransferase family 4 protein [Gammaproteobacteria bacterium]
MTVVQVLPALDSGGVERGTLEVAQALVRAGHRSIVISAGGRLVPTLTAAGSEHLSWPLGVKSPWTLRWIPRLRRLLERERVDILHARSRMPAWVAYLAWRGMTAPGRAHLVTTVHGLYSVNRYSAVMTRGERVIAVSEAARDYLLRYYPELPQERVLVIPRGVDRAEFPYGYRPPEPWLQVWRREYPQLHDQRVLTLPGRLTRLKGHGDFVELIGRLRHRGLPVHGIIVGGAGSRGWRYRNELIRARDAMGLQDAITLLDHRADVREIYAVSDLVLSLSWQPESFGRTVLEALSIGVPVVGYDHGGVGEILGRVFPAGRVPARDLPALEARVEALLREPVAVPETHPFTLQQMLQDTLDLYWRLAGDISGAGPASVPRRP